MGMVAYLRPATSEEVAALAADPDLLASFMFEGEGGTIDFDKAWHALHFMLTGNSGRTDSPASILATDDEHLLGTDEFGLGGYWLILPQQVKAFATELAGITDDDLAGRFDPTAMVDQHVYLSDMFAEEGSDALPYIMQGIPALRELTLKAGDEDAYIVGSLM
ncbi:DUF1877 family protein [Sphingomonas sp. RT2P30]|uniref:DUF1877 family protein n=1 Tax=Parasphingomonas halimpatiens TaxID=3096162 RepID=UPI002FC63987